MIDDYDAIAMVVRLFIEGAASGDRSKLGQAFHPSARMMGTAGDAYDLGRDEFIADYYETPMDSDGGYRGRLVSVQQFGDAAVAIVAEDGCWGSVSFVDILSLWRERPKAPWKIVNKTFMHTAGEVPSNPPKRKAP